VSDAKCCQAICLQELPTHHGQRSHSPEAEDKLCPDAHSGEAHSGDAATKH